MKDNVIIKKSFEFALRIVRLSKYLNEEKKEYVLSRQILKSGTSIGANVEESLGGQSDKDFIARLSIAYKEARETNYWLRLLKESDILEEKIANSLIDDCIELEKIITSILKTMKEKTINNS